jgi:hypothetical protein
MQRDKRRIARDEHVQAGMQLLEALPTEEEVEEATAVLACQFEGLFRRQT